MPSDSAPAAPTRSDLTEVTVVGADRTGIVAGITGLLFEYGVNIEDVEQSVQDGVFRMTLHADCAADHREAAEEESGEERPADCGFERSENPDQASGNAASSAADRREAAEEERSEGRSPSDHSSGRSPREDGEERPADCGFDRDEDDTRSDLDSAGSSGPVEDREAFRSALVDAGDELGVDVHVRFPDERDDGIAVLVTKEDHCLRALCERDLAADVRVVVGNHPDLESVAAEYDVPFYDLGDETGTPDEERLLSLLEEYDVDLVVLARYMRILSPNVVFRYHGRIVNVHPSLLPAFPGAQAYRQAVEAGVRVAGVTAHYVTTDLDQGPILTQRAFAVPADATVDDLQSRGRPLEADALVEAVRVHLAGDATVRRGRVAVAGDHQLGAAADD